MTRQDEIAITLPLDVVEALVDMAMSDRLRGWRSSEDREAIKTAEREIAQVKRMAGVE
jgi:hypothetical protein